MSFDKTSFKIYEPQFRSGVIEQLTQNAEVFNEASNGTIRLMTNRMAGNFVKESFYDQLSSDLVSRRDPTSNSNVSDQDLTQSELIGVKVNSRLGPVSKTRDAWRKMADDPATFSLVIGNMVGMYTAQDYVNTAVRSLDAAISGVSALEYDHTSTGTLTHSGLAQGLAKMGDQASRVQAWIMHSKAYWDLVDQSISDDVYNIGGMAIQQGDTPALGRPIIVTDDPSLKISGTPDNYVTLGLTSNASVLEDSEERDMVMDTITGEENIRERIQGEHAFNVTIKGFQWDTTNGGKSPTDSALGTSSNWDKAYSDDKNLAGVRVLSK